MIETPVHNKSAICVSGGDFTVDEGVKFSLYPKIGNEGGSFIYCNGGGTVNIQGGKIEYCGARDVGMGAVVYCKGGTVNITGGEFYECRASGGAVVYSEGCVEYTPEGYPTIIKSTVNIKGGSFHHCIADYGGLIYSKKGTVNISGGDFSECNSGSVYCYEPEFTMSGGNFDNCSGGVIHLCDSSNFKMTGGKIVRCFNNADGEGGAICAKEGSTVRLEKGTISAGAKNYGNAIYISSNSKLQVIDYASGQLQIAIFKDSRGNAGTDTSAKDCVGYAGIYLSKETNSSSLRWLGNDGDATAKSNVEVIKSNGNAGASSKKSNSVSETSAGENSAENTQSEANEASTNNDKGQSSDNDLNNNSYLKAFLDGDTDSKIVQIDKDSGIVLTAEDKIIPPGYHLFVERIQENSDKWKARIGDMDEKHKNDVEKMGMYDISIRNSNGDIFTLPTDPPVTVTVFIPCPSGYDLNDLQILHISSGVDGEFDEEVTTVDGKKYCKFKTNHFSPYAIIDEFSKGDLFEMIAPWLIGAAVVAIGAVAVVVVLKNKNKAGV